MTFSSQPSWARRGAVMRRVIDVVGATVGMVALSPLVLGISVAIKLSDGGPVFYTGTRVGRGGRHFGLYKFRTMVVGADKQGPGITTAEDQRVTRVGAVLRGFKLDEVPQLLNVLLGDMSFVGPRPEDPRYVAYYTPEQREVLAVRPGITSVASLSYRREEELLHGADWETRYVHEILPAKLAMERDYLRRRTVWSDLGVMIRTVRAVFNREDG